MAKSAPKKKPAAAKRAAPRSTPAVRAKVGKRTTTGKPAPRAAKPTKAKAVTKKTPAPTQAKKPAAKAPAAKAKSSPAKPLKVKRTPVKAAPARRPAPVKPGLVKAKAAAKSPVAPAVRPIAPIVTPTAAEPVSKPKRSTSGLGARDLQHFENLLLVKRREIVGDMHSMEGEALRSGTTGLSNLPVHMADMGTDNYEQEFTLGLVEKDRTLLREINHALAKIPAGTYGICEGTGEPIGKPRLEVQPWARYSIEYARLRERNGRGVRMF